MTALSQWYAFVQGRKLITYVHDEDRVVRRSGLGRDSFIPKPINNEDIIGRLKAISENKQAFNGLAFAIIGKNL
jgi:DNA-binding response OmpR family regulator